MSGTTRSVSGTVALRRRCRPGRAQCVVTGVGDAHDSAGARCGEFPVRRRPQPLRPFISVYLVTFRHWTQTDVGLITTASGLLGIALQTPIGAAIDLTPAKRGVIVLTMAAMTASAFIIFGFPTFWPMALATAVLALAGDAFVPAVRP
jgi:hypothetical protein